MLRLVIMSWSKGRGFNCSLLEVRGPKGEKSGVYEVEFVQAGIKVHSGTYSSLEAASDVYNQQIEFLSLIAS